MVPSQSTKVSLFFKMEIDPLPDKTKNHPTRDEKMDQEVLFAGCAAHSLAGRSEKVKKYDGVEEFNVLTFSRIFPTVSVAKVIAGHTACHFFLLGSDGNAYAFGRNEDGQVSLTLLSL